MLIGMLNTDHYSTLTLAFDQGTDSTVLRLSWDGVPVGQEDVTKRNFGDYYVRSIKTTFGYGKHHLPYSLPPFFFIALSCVPLAGFVLAWFLVPMTRY